MDKYFRLVENDYIVLIGTGSGDDEIGRDEYEEILAIINSRPDAEPGYTYRLRTNLTWELCEVPPVAEEDAEATEDDYLSALAELGVTVNEEI